MKFSTVTRYCHISFKALHRDRLRRFARPHPFCSLSWGAALCASALGISGPATAQPSQTDGSHAPAVTSHETEQARKLLRLAGLLIWTHQPEAACKVLTIATMPPTLETDRLYLLSHCLRDQGKIAPAIQALENMAKLMPGAAKPRTELASLYASQGNTQAAQTQLAAAAKLDATPDSTAATQHLAELLSENDPAALVRIAKEIKPWSVYIFTGLIYDTNINGGPSSDLIPGVIGDSPVTFKLDSQALPKSAWGATESLAANYTKTLGSGFSLLYQGGLTRTDYFDESSYRNDSMALATALIYHHGDYSVSMQPSLRYVRQADSLQEADTSVTARITRMLGPTWNITGAVSYTDMRIEHDRNRDAKAIRATVGFNTLLTHNLKVGADYTFLRERANDDVYSRHMNGPSVYALWKPRADLQLIANYRYLHSTYDKAMTYFPEPREDKQSTVGLTALWDISRYTGMNLTARLQYIYVDNPSNVGTSDYDRQLVITGLQLQF